MKIKFKARYANLLSPILDILDFNAIFVKLSKDIVLEIKDPIRDAICTKITGKSMPLRRDIFEIHKFATQMW